LQVREAPVTDLLLAGVTAAFFAATYLLAAALDRL
jgi:hypothetical protein